MLKPGSRTDHPWQDRRKSQDFGIEVPRARSQAPHRKPARFLVVIDSGGYVLAHLFVDTREQVAEFDAGSDGPTRSLGYQKFLASSKRAVRANRASARKRIDDLHVAVGHDPSDRLYEAFHFDDNARSADELAALVLAGRKRATAALAWAYESEGRPIPKPGDLSVVTLFSGEPVCVIETIGIKIVPFSEVDEDFAATEGEGGMS